MGTLKYGFSGLVDGQVGTTAMVLGWLALFCTVVPMMGVVVMLLSFRSTQEIRYLRILDS